MNKSCYYLLLFTLPFVGIGSVHANKISPAVIEAFQVQDKVDIVLQLEQLKEIKYPFDKMTKVEKGTWVLDTLRIHAYNLQNELKLYLDSINIQYEAFYIINAITLEVSFSQLQDLVQRFKVNTVSLNNWTIADHLDPPIPLDQQIQSRAVEWNINKINAPLVWQLGIKGEGVVIAGQDSGYEWNHTALIQNYRGYDQEQHTANHDYNWFDAIKNPAGQNDCGGDSAWPCDDNGHGTHTMGIMIGSDQGSNQIGVAPEAQWIGCRSLDNFQGNMSSYLSCFQWFLAPTNMGGSGPIPALAPDIVNNSWGCGPTTGCDPTNQQLINQAIRNLKLAGIFVVSAAGNTGPNCGSVIAAPGALTESFSVGATNSNDNVTSFSGRGPGENNQIKPNVVAPGLSIRSSLRNNMYGLLSGTSMSAPHVSGIIALVLSANPNLKGDIATVETILTASSIGKSASQDCGGIPAGNVPNNVFGHGRVDALAAVQLAMNFLSIELMYFMVEKIRDIEVEIKFKFGEEVPSAPFFIETSFNGNDWNILNTAYAYDAFQEFIFYDQQNWVGSKFYRIKWRNKEDDTYQYSPIRVVNINTRNNMTAFPNPTSDELFLNGAAIDGKYTMHINDITGKCIRTGYISFNKGLSESIDVRNFSHGIYQIAVLDERGELSYLSQFVKMK